MYKITITVHPPKAPHPHSPPYSCSPIVTLRVESGTVPLKPLSVSVPCQQVSGSQRSSSQHQRPKSSTPSSSTKTSAQRYDEDGGGSKRPSTAWSGSGTKGQYMGIHTTTTTTTTFHFFITKHYQYQ